MLHPRMRKVCHYDLFVGATPSEAPRPPLLDLLRQLKDASAKGAAVWMHNNDRAAIRLRRIAISNSGSRAVLLFHHANKDVADPAFAHLNTGDLRTEPKLTGEGIAVSAHAFVDLSKPQHPGVHQTLLEVVPGLPRSLVQSAMRAMLRTHCGYEFCDQNGEVRRARPVIEIVPRINEQLLAAVAKGTLDGITLLKLKDITNRFDEEPRVKIEEAAWRLSVTGKPTGNAAKDVLKSVIPLGRTEGFTNVRINFTDEYGGSKRGTFAIDDVTAQEAHVAKSYRVHLEKDLLQCEPEIRSDMSLKMDALLFPQKAASL